MLDRAHRFHGLGSLNFTYKQGSTVRSQACGLKFAYNSRRSTYRTAVVVSKKVHKSAVVRNRVRRRIYEIVRLLPIDGAYDMIISVYNESVVTMPAADLRREINGLLQKAGVVTSVKQ